MDALTARVAGLPSGPALISALKATPLLTPEKETLAGAVAAVLVDVAAEGGAFFFLYFFCLSSSADGRGRKGGRDGRDTSLRSGV